MNRLTLYVTGDEFAKINRACRLADDSGEKSLGPLSPSEDDMQDPVVQTMVELFGEETARKMMYRTVPTKIEVVETPPAVRLVEAAPTLDALVRHSQEIGLYDLEDEIFGAESQRPA